MLISDWISDVCSSDLVGTFALQDVEPLGIGLHQPVFDAVVYHLDEVAGARRPGLNIAPLRSSIAGLAAVRPLDAAETGGERGEDRIQVVDGFLVAADHHAIAEAQSPDPARGTDVAISCAHRTEPSDRKRDGSAQRGSERVKAG